MGGGGVQKRGYRWGGGGSEAPWWEYLTQFPPIAYVQLDTVITLLPAGGLLSGTIYQQDGTEVGSWFHAPETGWNRDGVLVPCTRHRME
jgi:hypothetical protein